MLSINTRVIHHIKCGWVVRSIYFNEYAMIMKIKMLAAAGFHVMCIIVSNQSFLWNTLNSQSVLIFSMRVSNDYVKMNVKHLTDIWTLYFIDSFVFYVKLIENSIIKF